MIKKYIKKPVELEAVQWDAREKTFQNILERFRSIYDVTWDLEEEDEDEKDYLYLESHGSFHEARPTDWVVILDRIILGVLSDEEFRETYEEAND
jgi:hypothetical protein